MRRSPLAAAATALALLLGTAACGSEPDVAGTRAGQARQAALDAGLPAAVADVLALAAEGATATYQVTYEGRDGAEIVVSQEPPNRRIDALSAGLIVQSQVVRDGVSYQCEPPAGTQPGATLVCHRTGGAVPDEGAFTDEALATFTEQLADNADAFDLTVEPRTIAETDATCLVAAPVAGTPIDGTTPGVETICLSPEGAQLLVDVGGQRVVASAYSTTVPTGTFDV